MVRFINGYKLIDQNKICINHLTSQLVIHKLKMTNNAKQTLRSLKNKNKET